MQQPSEDGLRGAVRLATDVDVELARRLRLRLLDSVALGHVMTADPLLGPAELSARLGISSGSGTELVDRLESAGHLTRHRDTQDRRRVSLHAAPHAVRAVLGELAPLFDALDDVAGEFTAEQQAVVVRYLRAAAGRMHRFVQRPG